MTAPTPLTVEEALLADVLAHPEDDTPRLILADWLQDYGQEDRGRFIRLSVSRPTERVILKLIGGEYADSADNWNKALFGGEIFARADNGLSAEELVRRLQAMLSIFPPAPPVGTECVLRRGFIEEITLSAEDWLTHHAALLASCPLRVVRLTTWPGRPSANIRWLIPGVWYGTNYLDACPLLQEREQTVNQMLKASWPSLTFHLPDDPG